MSDLFDTMKKYSINIEFLLGFKNAGGEVIFDLDNTIISEKDFLYAVYKEAAKKYFPEKRVDATNFLINEFEAHGRTLIYNKLLKKFGSNEGLLTELIDFQHSFFKTNLLKPYPWFLMYCKQLQVNEAIKIITNGTPQQQQNKIRSLDLTGCQILLDICYANLIQPKPSTASLQYMVDRKSKSNVIYVGDSEVDRQFAVNANIMFFDVSCLRDEE